MDDITFREPQVINGIKVDDSPKMPDGSSAMFVRINTKAEVKKSIDQLMQLNPQAPCSLDEEDGFLRIYAPDGDLVFAALPRDGNRELFVCRFHKEVFAQ